VVSKIIYSGTQQEVAESANESIDVIDKLLNYSKALSKKAPDETIGNNLMSATNKSAELLCNVLEVSKLNRQDPANQPKLEKAGEQVTAAVNLIVAQLRKYPRQMELSLYKGTNLDASAEAELFKCCQLIEESVKKLETLRPASNKKPSSMDEANTGLIEAAVNASKATGFLTQCSLHAQKERALKGRNQGNNYQPDPVLINGILSAVTMVGSSIHGLVGSTNLTIKNKGQNGEEESIIASANSIATATNHLCSASKAKADPSSNIQKQLGQAIKTVAQATAKLVTAAQSYTILVESAAVEESMDVSGAVGGVRKELEFQIKILQLEKELQKERKRQEAMRQAKFNAGL